MFDRNDVSIDLEAPAGDQRGPFYSWMLFTWRVNEMVPETFATTTGKFKVIRDDPAGWVTEQYQTARILTPPEGSDSMVIVQADDVRLFPIWDAAYNMVITSGLHRH